MLDLGRRGGEQRAAGRGRGGGRGADPGDRGAGRATGMPISADTFSVEVARRALAAGRSPSTTSPAAPTRCSSWSPGAAAATSSCTSRARRGSTARAPPYGDVVDHLKAWFEGRVERAAALGVARGADRDRPRPRLRPQHRPGPRDPAPARRAARARPAALRLALAQGLHRRAPRRLLGGAPARPGEREWGTVAAVALAVRSRRRLLRIHDRPLSPGDQGRRRDPGLVRQGRRESE